MPKLTVMSRSLGSLAIVAALFGALASPAPTPYAAAPASVYPADPLPLRRLCEVSDQIVLARVTKVEAHALKLDDAWPLDMAHLEVSATLKGPALPRLQALYNGDVICPAPPDFPPDTTVLAFLWIWDEAATANAGTPPRYGVSFIDSGNKPRDVARRRVVTQHVRAWTALQLLDDEQRLRAETDWLVSLTESPETRWDGSLDLSAKGSVHAALLDRSQLGRLVRVVSDSQELDSDPHWWSTREIMLLVARRLQDPSLERLALEERRRRVLIDAFAKEALRLLEATEG